jgi:hypothetical protein
MPMPLFAPCLCRVSKTLISTLSLIYSRSILLLLVDHKIRKTFFRPRLLAIVCFASIINIQEVLQARFRVYFWLQTAWDVGWIFACTTPCLTHSFCSRIQVWLHGIVNTHPISVSHLFVIDPVASCSIIKLSRGSSGLIRVLLPVADFVGRGVGVWVGSWLVSLLA